MCFLATSIKIMESSSISSPLTFSTFSLTAGSKRESEVSNSGGVEGSSNKKLKKFHRDPRICFTDLSRQYGPRPRGSQNMKNNEPDLDRDECEEKEKAFQRTEYCEDYYLSDDGCTDEFCRFAHGDCEVEEPIYMPPNPKDAIVFHPISGETEGRTGKCDPFPFQAIVFPHIGVLFGKKGEIFQWLCNLTGVKVTVENNKEIPGFKKVVISGPLPSYLNAKILFKALLANFVFFSESDKIPPVLDYKAVLCKKYAEGCCERDAGTCCLAHGESELRPRSFELLKKALEERREGKYYNADTRSFVPF